MYHFRRHLSKYLVAAFAKKNGPPQPPRPSSHHPIPIICQFIVNLMTCHPGLKVFIHNTKNAAQSIQEDPSDPEKPNPNKTRAMESSLWETKTLENHVLPLVAQACTFIEKPAFPNIEFDLDEVIGQDYDDVRSLSCPSKFCNFIPNYAKLQPKIYTVSC